MKRLLVIALIMLFGSIAYAGELKIGIVDVQRALNESEIGKKAKTELEGIIKKRQAEIDQKMLAKDRLAKELEKQQLVLKEEEYNKKQGELESIERELERLISDSNTEIQKLQRERETGILKDLDAIIMQIGKEGDFSLILPAEAIIYFGEGMDITDKVLERYVKSGGAQKGKDAPK